MIEDNLPPLRDRVGRAPCCARVRPPPTAGALPLRQAGEAQAGDEEFANFRCQKVRALAKAGDGQLGVDGKHAAKFGAHLIDMAEMRQRDDFGPHSHDRARLLMQGAVDPFDRLFEAPRDEMSDSDINGVARGMPIERAQTARPFDGLDRRLGLVAKRVE